MQHSSYLPQVKAQYEQFPYPPRNPENERRFLHASITECLDALNHYGYGGQRNFHRHFRALCAGGGTGDSTIFLAEQLRGSEAHIVYLDLSQASMDVAKARAAARGLSNIQWVQGSLLDLPTLGLGLFDYINCSGVLHHLENPDAGLNALCQVLAPGGVMGLMLYAKYGRTGIYHMQQLLRFVAENESPDTKLGLCKTLLGNLPETNWFRHSERWFNDLKNGDAALYDLLLHSQDRAYSIPELYDFVEATGLKIVTFLGDNAYDPSVHIKDKKLLSRVQAMDKKNQHAIGELLAGRITSHVFYAARDIVPPPTPDGLDMVPSFPVNTAPDIYEELYHLLKAKPGGVLFKTEYGAARVPSHPAMARLVKCMDGKRSLREIYAKALAMGDGKRPELQEAFTLLYLALAPAQMIFLRHKDVPYYLTAREIQARLEKMAREA